MGRRRRSTERDAGTGARSLGDPAQPPEVVTPGPDLLRELALKIGEAESLDDAFQVVLERICAATGWHLGQAWTPDGGRDMVLSSRAVHVETPGLDTFVELSRIHRFPPGVGLPGQVWESRKPTWIGDIRTELNFARAQAAAAVGIVGAMAVPVLDGRDPVAVLEFFVLEKRERDATLMDIVSAAAAQLGAVVRRRRAEEIARRTEERFRAVAETARDAIVSAGEDGRITYVNEAAERTFGYDPGELVGKPLTVLMPSRFRDAHRAGMSRFAASGDPHVIGKGYVELEGLRKSGGTFPVELSLATWTSDRRTFFTGIIRDITERKRAEEELRRLYDLKSDFISHAAHELRTPLTILSGFATTLAERRDDLQEQQLDEFFDILRFQSQRVLGLVDGLLDVARLEQERPPDELAALELEPIVRTAMLAAPPPEGWEIRTAIPDGLRVLADPHQLERVLVNLFVNAYRYGASPVRIEARPDGPRAVIVVEDSGEGVAEDVSRNLFEPFARGTAVQNVQGSGLGLTIVRQLMELMRGTVSYDGGAPGARFKLELGRGA